MQGTVIRVVADRGFGFIAPSDGGKDTYFHYRDLDPDLDFDETLLERRVSFETTSTEKGPRAANVRAVE